MVKVDKSKLKRMTPEETYKDYLMNKEIPWINENEEIIVDRPKKRGRPRKSEISEDKLQNKLIRKTAKYERSQDKFKRNDERLYNAYQELLERNEELEDKQIEANRKIKEHAKIKALYTKLMKDKNIPIEQRQSLKRNTRNGSMATLDELEAFETTRKFVDYDSDSDEEETQADIDKRIAFQMGRKLDRAEWQDKGYQKDLDKIQKEFEKLMKSGKEISIQGKKYKYDKFLGFILTGGSELVKKNGKYTVDTNFEVKKGLSKNIKKTLKKSVVEELDKKIKGSGVRKIIL